MSVVENHTVLRFLATEGYWITLAVLGGTARLLDAYLRAGTFPGWGRILANGLISAFSGFMAAQLVIQVDAKWALVAAGAGGYLGTRGIDIVVEALRKRVGLPEQPPKDTP
jgi:hypothetical protein